MGFNTAILIINDGLGDIERNPQQFVNGITEHLHRGGSFAVGSHCNPVEVVPSEHADFTQLISVGGNMAVKVLSTYGALDHHTEDGQVKLLKKWADKLGYRIVRKSAK